MTITHHTVEPGETLWGIAAQHGVTVVEVAAANRISAGDIDLIFPGAVLHVPTAELEPPPPPTPPTSTGVLTGDEMAYDMFGAPYRNDGTVKAGVVMGAPPFGAHEAKPLRLYSAFDWYEGSRWGQEAPWADWVIPWGQLFAAEGNGVWNVRLQVREVRMMYLDAGNVWRDVLGDVRESKMDGEFWDTWFTGQGSDSLEGIRSEAGNGGGWSVKLGSMRDRPNYATWHWFYSDDFYPRPPVVPGTKAVLSACQMRLIPDGENPAVAEFIASFGADNWPSEEGGRPAGKQITPFYQPRMKRVGTEWGWFSGHTFADWFTGGQPDGAKIGPTQIIANPPTIEGTL